MKKFSRSFIIILVALYVSVTLTSCKGINRGQGYVFLLEDGANYARITISENEYIDIYLDRYIHMGEWVTETGSSLIAIGSVYCPIANADSYLLWRFDTANDTDLAKEILCFPGLLEDESFYLTNPDRKKGMICFYNEETGEEFYVPQPQTSYRENISFSITSDQWKDYIKYDDSTVYRSSEYSFWYSPSQDIGEWEVGDQIIPIKIELLPYGPGITIYDLSNEEKKIILVAAGALSDNNTLVLDCLEGEMFYNNSQTIESLALTKTSE